jgi:hypothetical protein
VSEYCVCHDGSPSGLAVKMTFPTEPLSAGGDEEATLVSAAAASLFVASVVARACAATMLSPVSCVCARASTGATAVAVARQLRTATSTTAAFTRSCAISVACACALPAAILRTATTVACFSFDERLWDRVPTRTSTSTIKRHATATPTNGQAALRDVMLPWAVAEASRTLWQFGQEVLSSGSSVPQREHQVALGRINVSSDEGAFADEAVPGALPHWLHRMAPRGNSSPHRGHHVALAYTLHPFQSKQCGHNALSLTNCP